MPAGTGADFTWIDGERLIRFGEGALEEAPRLLSARGFDGFVLLTTERALVSAPALGEGAAAVLQVPSGPVPEAAAAVRDGARGRALVALGGGRVIDSAKAIAGADGLLAAAVPTTLSGAEMTPFHRMPAGVDEFRLVRPALVVASPELMASQPSAARAASAMNALAHAFEALYTPVTNPVAELAALRAAALLGRGLSGDEPGRTDLALGALLAGYASGVAGFALHHVVCQTIVRVAGTPHARTNAVVLPHAVRAMGPRAPEAVARFGDALGAGEGGEEAAVRVASLSAQSGVTSLGELGVERSLLPDVVSAVMLRPELQNTPDPPGADELMDLLETAL